MDLHAAAIRKYRPRPGPRPHGSDVALDLCRGSRPVDPAIILDHWPGAGCSFTLSYWNRPTAEDLRQVTGEKTGPDITQAIGKRLSGVTYIYVYFSSVVYCTGVESSIHAHEAEAGRHITAVDRRGDRVRAAVARQQRCVQVDASQRW